MANARRRRRSLFVRIKWCQVEMEINIFLEHGHTNGVIIRAAHPSVEIRVRGNLRRFFSAERLARTYLRCDPEHGLEYVRTERREHGERAYRWRIWYSRREEGITSWEDSRYPRDLVNRCAGPRNFKPGADTFDSLAISSTRSEFADSTSWHTSYFTYVIFFMRSVREALSKTVISFSRKSCPAQFRVNCRPSPKE